MEYGGPEALRVLELPEPKPGPGEVRIRVHAATVNPADTVLRSGAAAAALGGRPPPYVLGMDAAGVVDELGPDVDNRLSVGLRVIALVLPTGPHGGAYATQVVVPAASVVPIPDGADFPAASTLLMNGLTARMTLDALALPAGSTVGVFGAAGAVGGYVIQLANADGLWVIADAAPADEELVRELGARQVVPRGAGVTGRIRVLAADGVPGLVDAAVLDAAALPAVADGGGLATIRGWAGPAERGVRVHPVRVSDRALDTAALARLRAQAAPGGPLTLRVADVLPAGRAAEAHRRLAGGGVRGRLVLDLTTLH